LRRPVSIQPAVDQKVSSRALLLPLPEF